MIDKLVEPASKHECAMRLVNAPRRRIEEECACVVINSKLHTQPLTVPRNHKVQGLRV